MPKILTVPTGFGLLFLHIMPKTTKRIQNKTRQNVKRVNCGVETKSAKFDSLPRKSQVQHWSPNHGASASSFTLKPKKRDAPQLDIWSNLLPVVDQDEEVCLGPCVALFSEWRWRMKTRRFRDDGLQRVVIMKNLEIVVWRGFEEWRWIERYVVVSYLSCYELYFKLLLFPFFFFAYVLSMLWRILLFSSVSVKGLWALLEVIKEWLGEVMPVRVRCS